MNKNDYHIHLSTQHFILPFTSHHCFLLAHMPLGIPVRIRAGTANNSHMGTPSTHNEIVPIRVLEPSKTGTYVRYPYLGLQYDRALR